MRTASKTLLAAVLLAGCSTSLYRSRAAVAHMPAVASEHELACARLDDAQGRWGLGAVVTTTLSGGTSTVMAIVDNRDAVYGLAGGSVALAVLSVVAGYMQGRDVKLYQAACTVTP